MRRLRTSYKESNPLCKFSSFQNASNADQSNNYQRSINVFTVSGRENLMRKKGGGALRRGASACVPTPSSHSFLVYGKRMICNNSSLKCYLIQIRHLSGHHKPSRINRHGREYRVRSVDASKPVQFSFLHEIQFLRNTSENSSGSEKRKKRLKALYTSNVCKNINDINHQPNSYNQTI